jgi:chromate reductase
MKKIVSMAGSNSQKSINKSLLSYAGSFLENVEITSIDLNDYILPIYGVDNEAENGIPPAAKRLDELLNTADGFLIALAEHNGSYTAVFKNTIDWLSRANMKIWRDKPMLLMASSPGSRGGTTVLESAKAYFPYLGGTVVADFSLPSFFENFSEDEISNTVLREELAKKLQLFERHLNIK